MDISVMDLIISVNHSTSILSTIGLAISLFLGFIAGNQR